MFDSAFWAMLGQSSPVIVVVYLVLLGMSLTSWALIFYKAWQLKRSRSRLAAGLVAFEQAPDLATALGSCGEATDACSARLAREGMDEVERMKGTGRETAGVLLENVRLTLAQSAETETDKLYGSMGYLAAWANVAPLLGLFGTVWGIMNSFTSFTDPGTATIARVAPGLAEALGTTAAGLLVAIPAALAYNLFLNTLSSIETGLNRFARIFLNRVKQELPRREG